MADKTSKSTSQTRKKQIVILGAGPAGLGLAWQLLKRHTNDSQITVLERCERLGGLTTSFERDGLIFDYGSHRLHPATSAEIMQDISTLLGDNLLRRPRFGRIYLMGRFLKFPLSPVNLLFRLPLSFMFSFIGDILQKLFKPKTPVPEVTGAAASFASILQASLGKTMCRQFYFPYAQKLWGLPPEELSPVQAQKRVAANSLAKIIKKALGMLPGLKKKDTGIFYYPAQGFGQICSRIADEIKALGGKIQLSSEVTRITQQTDGSFLLYCGAQTYSADFVFSTIPVTDLVLRLQPAPPPAVTQAAGTLVYRAMVVFYFILEQNQFTPYDAHYFPGEDLLFSRMSEPKNYSAAKQPAGLTGLCFEIPCQQGDAIWQAEPEELQRRVLADLEKIGLPVQAKIKAAFLYRLPEAYPVYRHSFVEHFNVLDEYVGTFTGLVTLGRQGLFAHDNTHHTLEMAYRAADCLGPDFHWDAERWAGYRKQFDLHVVED